MKFADFNYCPTCGKQAQVEGHFIISTTIPFHTPHFGAVHFRLLICIHSLPTEREDCPLLSYSFPVFEESLNRSINELEMEKSEALKKLGRENIDTLTNIARKLDEESEG